MSYRRKTIDRWKHQALLAMAFVTGLILQGSITHTTAWAEEQLGPEFISPLSDKEIKVIEVEKEVKVYSEDKWEQLNLWVAEAVNEFIPEGRKSETTMIMHCLLHRENGHNANNAHGDNGMAGGPLQFWEETWTRMRGRMIADGYATDMTNRYNTKEAIRTTVYAISKGWALEWGPINRDAAGSDFATCQTPSWY